MKRGSAISVGLSVGISMSILFGVIFCKVCELFLSDKSEKCISYIMKQ